MVSGFRAGQSAGEYAVSSGKSEVDYGEVKRVKDRVLAPLGRGSSVDVNDVVYQVHEAIVPVKYNFHREGGRLKEALGIVDKAKQNLAKVGAKDYHGLMKYHQTESMAVNAEWTLKSALMREESRGSHRREDYPNRDDKNWLKWIVIEDEKGTAKLSTEPIPIGKYKIKP